MQTELDDVVVKMVRVETEFSTGWAKDYPELFLDSVEGFMALYSSDHAISVKSRPGFLTFIASE